MSKTSQDWADEAEDFFDEFEGEQPEGRYQAILREQFWECARRKVDEVANTGANLGLWEEPFMAARVFTFYGDVDAVAEVRDFLADKEQSILTRFDGEYHVSGRKAPLGRPRTLH